MFIYKHNHPFRLECGAVLPSIEIAYDTFGTLSPAKDNVIWVFHALTANSDVSAWWKHTVEEGKFLDPSRWFVVCANTLGSCYGTTGAASINPATGKIWGTDFPLTTVRDAVGAHKILADTLGIDHVKLMLGSSIGGFQALEMAVMFPEFAERIALIATSAQASPWVIAINESQRMAIETDSTWGELTLHAGGAGMSVARTIGLLSYRGEKAYNATQKDVSRGEKLSGYSVQSYQRYQGEKLRRRFNAYSYYRLTQMMDSHDIARGRGIVANVLAGIWARTLLVAISSDILFPPSELQLMHTAMPYSEYVVIESEFAHDGFLIEHDKLNELILRFINS